MNYHLCLPKFLRIQNFGRGFMNKFISILGAGFVWIALIAPANAGSFGAGVSLHAGTYETDGSETEKTVTGVTSETTKKSISEGFYGASVYAEFRTEGGWTLGVDYVPVDISLGTGSRHDTNAAAEDAGDEADVGFRKAEATVEDLMTIYAHVPVGPAYLLLGYHTADISTTEQLPTSTYPDVDVHGWQYGIGVKSENNRVRAEIAYSDFDNITLTSSANTNKITASADAVSFKLSIGF